MKKIAIIGANGMLGSAAKAYFSKSDLEVVSIGRNEFDIIKDPFIKLEKLVEGVSYVLNASAIIKPRFDKFSVEEIWQVNAIFPKNLAKFCLKKNISCIQITTDGVFSGKSGNYSEEDYYDNFDLYSLSKASGETADCMFLRTSIIGEELSQGRSLLEWVKSNKGKEIKGFTNHFWNGVTTLYLSEIVENILKSNLYQKGTFHIFSQTGASKYQLLSLINEIYDLKIKILPIEADEKRDLTLSSIYQLNSVVSKKDLVLQLQELKTSSVIA